MSDPLWPDEALPETYYVVTTLDNLTFYLDPAEGDRVNRVLDGVKMTGGDTLEPQPFFVTFHDYADVVARVNYSLLSSCYLSSPQSREFDKTMRAKRKAEDRTFDDE